MRPSDDLLQDCSITIPAPHLIGLTPIQIEYYNDNYHRFIIVGAGRRSRKTLIAKRKWINNAITYRDTLWFHGAPTYKQAKGIFWDDLKQWTKHIRKYKSDSDLFVKLKNDSEIHVVGLDVPERIEGRTKSWNGAHVAEFGDTKPDAWDKHIRPVLSDPVPAGTPERCAILDGVPDPFKAGFAEHKRKAQLACGGSIPTIVPFDGAYGSATIEGERWAFYGWHSADVLPYNEIMALRKTTDPQTFRIEYEASFESLAGRVYYGFENLFYPKGNLDSSITYNRDKPIVMAFDFNVSPMTAVLGHINRNADNQQEWLLFKGYHLKNSNTKQLMERIITEHPDTKNYFLTPCQSSTARQSSQEIENDGYRTDMKIIYAVAKEYGVKVTKRSRRKNPLVSNGIKATNMMLSSRRLRFNPNDPGLMEFKRDLDELTYKEGTSAIDESDKMRNHISKGVAYKCEYSWPVKKELETAPDEEIETPLIV